MNEQLLQIKEVSKRTGLSIRMLRHYDKIGLCRPAEHSRSGYRLYGDRELELLGLIGFYRELDFPLKEIKTIIDSPAFDRTEALRKQKQLLVKKQSRLKLMIQTIDAAIEALKRGDKMNTDDIFRVQSKKEIEEFQRQYEEEVTAKFPAEKVRESSRRTLQYSDEDWKRIQAEVNEILQTMLARYEYGPADSEVQKQVGRYQAHMSRYYYDVSDEILAGLGRMYLEDERFKSYFDRFKPGFADFMSRAIAIYTKK